MHGHSLSNHIYYSEIKMEQFDYKQVELTEVTQSTHFRLIYLSPADPKIPSAISLELKVMPVDDTPTDYITLSYTWGQPEFTHPVTINSQVFHITPSLAEALFHIRRKGFSLPIWVDQICINQRSADEKTAQVILMKKIYGQAIQTIIWLGPAADGSDQLMAALGFAGQRAADAKMDDLLTKENWTKFVRWTQGEQLENTPPFAKLCEEIVPLLDIPSLKAWFLRKWFHRVWTIQEYCLAEDPVFLCGDKTISINRLRLAWTLWEMSPLELRTAKFPKPSGPLPSGPDVTLQQKGDRSNQAQL